MYDVTNDITVLLLLDFNKCEKIVKKHGRSFCDIDWRATQSAWISMSYIEEATVRYSCTHWYKSLCAARVEVCLRVWCSRCSSRPLPLGFG